jgi:Caspase domain
MLRVVVALLVLLVPSVAQAEKRLALLIGNEGYAPAIGALANPHNDVALLEAALKSLGFEMDVVRDVGLGGLTRAVNAYARRVQAAGPDAVSFIYYSSRRGRREHELLDPRRREDGRVGRALGSIYAAHRDHTQAQARRRQRHALRCLLRPPQHLKAHRHFRRIADRAALGTSLKDSCVASNASGIAGIRDGLGAGGSRRSHARD